MAEPDLATGKGRLPVITVDAMKNMVTAASARRPLSGRKEPAKPPNTSRTIKGGEES